MIAAWPCPGPDGQSEEYALAFDRGRKARLLIVPALFDEANRMRRMLVDMMRLLDDAGVDSFLPDLPGCNESLQDFSAQSLHGWRRAMVQAARHFGASDVLAVRGGALVFPHTLPGLVLEPAKGGSLLRQLIRARVIVAREAGRQEDSAGLLETGRTKGLELAGWHCGASLIAGLETAVAQIEGQRIVAQGELGGGGLWLRAEPAAAPEQSAALAKIVQSEIAA
ncbi:MAG: hypothetical protein B7Y36_01300 [Novosphingobium sp. 28-62-57]|uniref:hypothetical protein n=1 Tax=unclassified Novosphingobium TaxID=2644732 RepID=UPI000BCCB728|nr:MULTISPECIES: hypothetical protein [unclassified Novosphingobium]OYW50055.1 MAG: hypothetical protein B7Z34_07310 [Novosphingobium sp. 12-62-10]OYZ24029.1 MAG: hypothetical protein B7Y31_14265 [Novosphingobium sp. 16-62-11]OZA40379.1 MAG: hypothetical protein B7X92_01690 [Novosphingobium sp. 17-62-9]OYZ12209.1 MAG: hypothetical protein B7Y36_01300 [Novosphingobium sp. 28-62-57]HQS68942.1 hypothetical protein [Novosphingobium sp.]